MTRQELIDIIKERRSFLCVGLDTDLAKVPACVREGEDPVFTFNKAIIDATAPYCVAYKPNTAFYESMGLKGWEALEKTVAYIKESYPRHLVIADAKRGDIGNTSRMYASTFFDLMDVDAVTVAPYMGEDSVSPFLGHDGKWVVLLALTSNKGSHDFQFTEDAAGVPLWEKVIRTSSKWGRSRQHDVCGWSHPGSHVRRDTPCSARLVPARARRGGAGGQPGRGVQIRHDG